MQNRADTTILAFVAGLMLLGAAGVGFLAFYDFPKGAEAKNIKTVVEVDNNLDTDKDGLTDVLERTYGTDPNNPDTDGDGYPDGVEVRNNYNPKGSGRLSTFKMAEPELKVVTEVKQPESQVAGSDSKKYEPNMVYIESLGISVPLQYAKEANEKSYQEALLNGVGHHPDTAMPGELGNVYIFGHSSDYRWSKGKYKTIFATLPKIKIGAEIVVTDNLGNAYKYKVTQSLRVEATDIQWLSQEGYQKKLLTLQTSYPVGTAKARWVVRAEIIE